MTNTSACRESELRNADGGFSVRSPRVVRNGRMLETRLRVVARQPIEQWVQLVAAHAHALRSASARDSIDAAGAPIAASGSMAPAGGIGNKETTATTGRSDMKSTYIMASLLALGAAQFAGCAVTDGQSTVGQYTGDTTITIKVKAKMAEDPAVSASRISVETVNGTVQLSGFATSQAEKDRAEAMARGVDHVKQVRNSIVVQPK